MRPLPPLPREAVQLESVADRPTRVDRSVLGSATSVSVTAFVDSLPRVLAADDLRAVAAALRSARKGGRPIVMGVGGHVVKTGLCPLLCRCLEEGVITALALVGGAALHDLELACWGRTSEDVADRLPTGRFGMVRETGDVFWGAVGSTGAEGLGWALGCALAGAPHATDSILATAARLGLAATVHPAFGAETVFAHPATDGPALGAAADVDFRRLAAVLADLEDGVYLNVGSAVILPEVFAKALNLARNVTGRSISRFTAADLDMVRHYRPGENVVSRPVASEGRGYRLTGHHEILVPLLLQLAREQD